MIAGGNATVFVKDMDQAVRFYVEALGLKLRMRAGNHWAEIDAGKGLIIGLHPPSEGSAPPGQRGAIELGLNVTEPIEKVVAALRGRGVNIPQIHDDGQGSVKLAFFKDPEGNPLYLCEYKKPSA